MVNNNLEQYSYYVYSGVLARVDRNNYQLEVNKGNKSIWERVEDAQLWKRIQEEGEKISEREAKAIIKK